MPLIAEKSLFWDVQSLMSTSRRTLRHLKKINCDLRSVAAFQCHRVATIHGT